MSTVEEVPPAAVSAVEDSSLDNERKLWFDYVTRLNDRQLDSTRRSGATTWVLLGVAGAILYRFVPRLPGFLSIPGSVKQSLIIFLLQLDMVFYFLVALVLLIWYCGGGVERRLLPDSQRRISWVLQWIFIPAYILVALAHFWVAPRIDKSLTFVRGAFWGLGVWAAVNLLLGIRKELRTIRQARKNKIPAPRFSPTLLNPNWESLVGFFIFSSIGTVSAVALFLYLRAMHSASIAWVDPLSAASLTLTVCAVLATLLYRGLHSVRAETYTSLETAILVEGLRPSEIKSRFIKQFLGPSLSDWLTDLMTSVAESEKRMSEFLESAKSRLDQTKSIDRKYSLERKGRATELLKELQATLQEHQEVLRRYQFQITEFSSLYPRANEIEILKKVLAEWKSQIESIKQRAQATHELGGEVIAFIRTEEATPG